VEDADGRLIKASEKISLDNQQKARKITRHSRSMFQKITGYE